MKLIVCTMRRHAPNPHSCGNGGGLEIAARLEQALAAAGMQVTLERVACLGMCLKGPNVKSMPDGKIWHGVGVEDVDRLVAQLNVQD